MRNYVIGLAIGPGIKNNDIITKGMNLCDITPLVAKLLDVSFTTAYSKIPAGMLAK